VFSSVLSLISDEAQDAEELILSFLRAKDDDSTGLTNISEVKSALDEVNKKFREQNRPEPLTAVELADVAKLITDAHGYKEIPYQQVHRHIIDYKVRQLSLGRINSRVNNLEAYLQELLLALDEKKTGRVKVEAFEEVLSKGDKIRLTRSQLYLLKSLLGVDGKGEINYADNLKFMAELVKRFFLGSSKKKKGE
jgi:Ca2+-binding EF-hand superfamily protein